jgi:hypothetical protein
MVGRASQVVRQWWLLPLGIVIALLALVALLRGGPTSPGAPPMDHIDQPSRERLDQVLREAEE